MRVERGLACGLAATVSLLALEPALAQSTDSQKIEQLQRQTELLEKQIKALKEEIAQTRKKTEKVESAQAVYAAHTPTQPTDPKSPVMMKAPSILDKVKITPGGFIAAETVFRSRNMVNDIGTTFNNIPYPFSPLYGEREFHGTARQTRLSMLIEGNIDPQQKLAGYVEGDFLGIGAGSNFTQTNSWVPRLRHGYFTYDNTDWGFHFLAGQSWSLLTQNTSGITPRKENIPLTIEANYVAGFDFTRNWQIRLVKDFGPMFAIGLSLENPAEQVYASTGAIANGGSLNGLIVNWANAGNSFLGSGAFANNFNTETAPDIIGKVAFDPGWGHYEAFGIVRFFTDSVFICNPLLVPASGVCPT